MGYSRRIFSLRYCIIARDVVTEPQEMLIHGFIHQRFYRKAAMLQK
jgi:hypothetical protein